MANKNGLTFGDMIGEFISSSGIYAKRTGWNGIYDYIGKDSRSGDGKYPTHLYGAVKIECASEGYNELVYTPTQEDIFASDWNTYNAQPVREGDGE